MLKTIIPTIATLKFIKENLKNLFVTERSSFTILI